jgi:ABC-2 type transport system ATP-binding protein
MSKLMEVIQVTKRYQGETVLDKISLQIEAGRVIGLLGKNGVGKTTLLRILSNLNNPDEGKVLFEGKLMDYRSITKLSYLFGENEFYDWMRVMDAIQYYQDFYPDFDIERANRLCQEFHLEPKKMIKKLSRGNKERLFLLLTLCRRVKLYIMDEPMEGLDPSFKRNLKKILLENLPEGATVVLATHLLKDLELLFDQVMIMQGNQVNVIDTDEIRSTLNKSVEDYYMEVILDGQFD